MTLNGYQQLYEATCTNRIITISLKSCEYRIEVESFERKYVMGTGCRKEVKLFSESLRTSGDFKYSNHLILEYPNRSAT